MLIEALTPLRVKADGKRYALEPGQVVDLSPDCAARLLERAPGKVRMVSTKPSLAVRPGDRITWQGADGTDRSGVVDFLHSSHNEVWAFCTLPTGWCAVHVTAGVTIERRTRDAH